MISFIITTYNRANELSRLLLSLERQTDNNFEVIIVDDNSTDATATVCEEWLGRHGGQYIRTDVADADRKASVRYAANINYVLTHASIRGDLLMYLCDDVELAPDCVETIHAHFAAHPDHLAGYVSEEWVQGGARVKLLWYAQPMVVAFCLLDHSQVVHRVEAAQPWGAVHPLAWAFSDGIFFERLLGRVGTLYPIGDATPRVTNKILETSVCRQPIGDALERLRGTDGNHT